MSWPFFFLALVAPVLLTILTARFSPKSPIDPAATAFWSAVISGIVSGMMLARRLGRSGEAKALFCIVLVPAMFVVSLVMNFFGCLAGSQGFRIH